MTTFGLDQHSALLMIKRRAEDAGLPTAICYHTFHATGSTAYQENGGTVENAWAVATHESPRTTKLNDCRSDRISLQEWFKKTYPGDDTQAELDDFYA